MSNDVTQILGRIESDEPQAAARRAQEPPGQTLQATALVHEAYVRLVGAKQVQRWDSRGRFFAAAAEAMRRIPVEQARRKTGPTAGGGYRRVALDQVDAEMSEPSVDLLALNDALDRLSARYLRIAELVKLRFFVGITRQQAADVLGISTTTADDDWAFAKGWLRVELSRSPGTAL